MNLDWTVVTWALGASAAATIALAILRALRIRARAARIVAIPSRSIAEARSLPAGSRVLVRGKARRVDASGTALTATPLTKRPMLWWRLTVRGETHRPGMLMWNNLLVEAVGRDFILDDGSGAAIRVALAAAGPRAVVCVRDAAVERTLCMDGQRLRDDVRAFLMSRPDLVEAAGGDGNANIAVRTFEEAIAEGDEVYVAGVVEGTGAAASLAPAPDGLVVAHGDPKELASTGKLWATGPNAA